MARRPTANPKISGCDPQLGHTLIFYFCLLKLHLDYANRIENFVSFVNLVTKSSFKLYCKFIYKLYIFPLAKVFGSSANPEKKSWLLATRFADQRRLV